MSTKRCRQAPATDATTIRRIARRAMDRISVLREQGETSVGVQIMLTVCHTGCCPLRLDALLAADDFNFAHDILGIRRHLDPDTKLLTDCFRPRYRLRGSVHRDAA